MYGETKDSALDRRYFLINKHKTLKLVKLNMCLVHVSAYILLKLNVTENLTIYAEWDYSHESKHVFIVEKE